MHKTANCMKYSGYWLSIVETHPDNHMLHTFLSCNLSFPSLSPVTSVVFWRTIHEIQQSLNQRDTHMH